MDHAWIETKAFITCDDVHAIRMCRCEVVRSLIDGLALALVDGVEVGLASIGMRRFCPEGHSGGHRESHSDFRDRRLSRSMPCDWAKCDHK